MKKLIFALTAFSLVAGSAPSLASPCKDKQGKFVKCPAPKAAPCKDAKGRFVKCPKLCRDKAGHFAKCR